MEEEEKIKRFEPTTGFTVLLFLFFVTLVTESIQFATQYSAIGIEIFNEPDYPWYWRAFDTIFRLLIILYGFKAITLGLSGHRNAISTLRWALFIFFIYWYSNYSNNIAAQQNPFALIFCLFEILLSLFFWLYTFFSKGAKQMFPKGTRKKYIWGTIGLFMFLTYVGLIFGMMRVVSVKRHLSNPVKSARELSLQAGEYADSLTIYKALPEWKHLRRIYETTYFETNDGLDIRIRSCNIPEWNRSLFATYYGTFLEEDAALGVQEVSYLDTIVDEKTVYSSVYEMTKPNSSYYAQVIGIFDKESYKSIMFIVRGDTIPLLTSKDITRVTKGVDFRLENRTIKK